MVLATGKLDFIKFHFFLPLQIEKYLKKLDQEIHKFKLELEADNAGITSKLERAVQLNQNYDFNEENYYGSNLFDDKSQLFDFQLSSGGQTGSEAFLSSPAAPYDPFNLFYNYPSGANAQLSRMYLTAIFQSIFCFFTEIECSKTKIGNKNFKLNFRKTSISVIKNL